MSDPTRFHRLFGLAWFDFFRGTPITVEPEIDLSLKQQYLDLAILRPGQDPLPRPLPDGFEDLVAHNLVTFKSYQEALDAWALCEAIGHYVNYRKQYSPSMRDLLPESAFQLFAVSVRFPQNLAGQVELTRIQQAVYEVRVLGLRIRIIVVHDLPLEQQNAMLHLFSANEEQLRYGQEHYRPHSTETSTLLYDLFKAYSEDPNMADKLKEYVRESLDELLRQLPKEELRKRLSTGERLEGLSPEERLEGLSPEERLEGLSPEERLEGLSPEERLKGLSPEQLRAAMEAAQRKLQPNGTPPKPD
jgi:hypothetical protein